MQPCHLREEDISGASLNGRKPEELKVPELKLWLSCRGAPTKGKKAKLVERVNAFIKYGWDSNLVNPHGSNQPTPSKSTSASSALNNYAPPGGGWKPIKTAFETQDRVPQFNNGHIVSFFVTRSVIDGLPSGDFKSINSSAENLFRCGHVQAIEVCTTTKVLHVGASCLPEMKKDRVYKLNLALNLLSYDIVYASCGCPAGKGPSGSCKHISALCYAFSDFCKYGKTPDFLTCTDRLQSWNQPRGRKVEPIPVDKLGSRRSELTNKTQRTVIYDPRPTCFRNENPASIEKLRCDLLNSCSSNSCALLTILVPSTKHIKHDHTYALSFSDIQDSCSQPSDTSPATVETESVVNEHSEEVSAEMSAEMETVVEKLCLNKQERLSLEANTKKQNNDLWHEARRCRITGSKCGRILIQKTRTVALLKFSLYPRPFYVTPKQIEWGRKKEPVARKVYVEYGHPNLTVDDCGFFVHLEKGWLGASPDAQVYDPDSLASHGIAEFKCLFSKADVSVKTACEDPTFYCKQTDDQDLMLDRSHPYYHQVQLQLYTSFDSWCDFCVYTSKDLAVERIYHDSEWQKNHIPRLDAYFHECMLPEIIHPRVKPGYYL